MRYRALVAMAMIGVLVAAGCEDEAPKPTPPEESAETPPSDGQPQDLPTETITVAGLEVEVEVANEPGERRKGMMFREDLGPDELMLFVFAEERGLAFWNKNVPVDLDVAFVNAEGIVNGVSRLEAGSERQVRSPLPATFALEAPAGWMDAHAVGPGARVVIPEHVAASGAPE